MSLLQRHQQCTLLLCLLISLLLVQAEGFVPPAYLGRMSSSAVKRRCLSTSPLSLALAASSTAPQRPIQVCMCMCMCTCVYVFHTILQLHLLESSFSCICVGVCANVFVCGPASFAVSQCIYLLSMFARRLSHATAKSRTMPVGQRQMRERSAQWRGRCTAAWPNRLILLRLL